MTHLTVPIGFLFVCLLGSSAMADTFPADEGNIEITPLIHSSVQLEYRGTVVQIDPWNRLGLEGAKPADLILLTDDVGHHLDVEAIARLRKPDTQIIMAANGRDQVPDGIVMANGDTLEIAGMTIEAIPAYDIIPGEPSHPRGEANGYVVTLGGQRLFFAGVTECVPEVTELTGIDVAFLAMNVPPNRMTPAAAAECARALGPDAVYVYHYDQDYARRALNPGYEGSGLPGGITVDESLRQFADALSDTAIEVRTGAWYPPLK
ncbi:MAG: MBL fold metallo-hydrolase [Pseudohongiellaceae bacterium]